jgi:hypothetical protein
LDNPGLTTEREEALSWDWEEDKGSSNFYSAFVLSRSVLSNSYSGGKEIIF